MTAEPDPPAAPGRPQRRPGRLAGLAAAVVLAALAGYLLAGVASRPAATDRQAEVAERGQQVMPFDLDRTTHVFADRPDGGTQTVVADDPTDAEQVSRIRGHLREEAARFAVGDFADPARIHGDAMPGLARLRQDAHRISVRYQDLPDGARITYTTTDAALVQALHTWFQAQTADHGRHAEHPGG